MELTSPQSAPPTTPVMTQPEEHIIGATIVHTAALLLACVGNLSAVIIIGRSPRLHTPSCILVLALAFADLGLALVWNSLTLALLHNDVTSWLASNSPVCQVVGMSWQVMLSMSTLLQGTVALDRYLFIVHPLKYQVYVTNRRALACSGLVLLLSCFLAATIWLNGGDYQFSASAMTCISSRLWPILYLALAFLPSVLLATLCYRGIWTICSSVIKHARFEQAHLKRATISAAPSPFCSPLIGRAFSAPDMKVGVSEQEVNESQTHRESLSPEIRHSSPSAETGQGSVYVSAKKNVFVRSVSTVTHSMTTMTTVLGNSIAFSDAYSTGCLTQVETERRTSVCTKSAIAERRMFKTQTPSMVKRNDAPVSAGKPGLSSPVPNSLVEQSSPCRPSPQLTTPSQSNLDLNKLKCDLQIAIAQNPMEHLIDQMCKATKAVRKSNSPRNSIREKSKKIPSTLQWAAVCNPVITWMLLPEFLSGDASLFASSASLSPPSRTDSGAPSISSRRRFRPFVLVVLPVVSLAVSVLPLITTLLFWEDVDHSQTGFIGVRVVCHISYLVIPSFTSLLQCLTNKPYRRVVKRQMCCSNKRRR